MGSGQVNKELGRESNQLQILQLQILHKIMLKFRNFMKNLFKRGRKLKELQF